MASLQLMKSVVAVAESRSFTAAAERLLITTQMVSKHVKALEAHLGVRIFDRTTRRVRVTEVGEAVVARCQRILDAVDELEASVQEVEGAPRGTLRVAAPLTFGEMYVAPHLPAYRARCPGVDVTLMLTDRYVNLVEEGVDVAVRVGHLEDSALVARKIAETEIVCVGSPAYVQARGVPAAPEALAGHALVHDDNLRGARRWPFRQGEREVRVEVKPVAAVNSARAVLTLVEAGMGLALLPRFVAAPSLAEGRLVQVLREWGSATFPVQLVFPHAHLLSARVRSFADHLIEALGPTAL